MNTMRRRTSVLFAAIVTGATLSHGKTARQTTPGALPFQIEEATIDDVHAGIESGAVTCTGVVQAYLFNREDVRTVNTTHGPDSARPDALFGASITYFAPREVQLGLRFVF